MSPSLRLPAGLFVLIAALALMLQVSFAQQTRGEPMILPVDEAPLVAMTEEGERQFTIEIAETSGQQARGLMFREEMDDDHGLLFAFPVTRRASFWMRNTPMPLDLVFIGEDGHVVSVEEGVPFSLDSIGPDDPVRFVLEIKAGIAQETGIEPGTRLRHPRIDEVAGAD
ncbi:MAG: DUF192 domain-containing protein [Mesorhizobium sp.]|nr:DUF192 domain-containing protein [Mesorhizobium sp.]